MAFALPTIPAALLAAGLGSCTVTATFTPATAGPSAASLSVAYVGSGSPVLVALSGTGVQSATTTTVAANFDPTMVNNPTLK